MWGSGYILDSRWRLINQIGHGSFSTVWRAEEISSSADSKSQKVSKNIKNHASDSFEKRYVAIKNVRLSRDLDSARRALREILLLKHFRGYDNIIQLIDVVIIPGTHTEVEELCIVTELMETDLDSLIRSHNALPVDTIRLLMFQLLRGVSVLHEAHVLHRDLKPKNVLVNSDLETKICDFGMGRSKLPNSTNSRSSSPAPLLSRDSEPSMGLRRLKMTQLSHVATASYRAPDGILNISFDDDSNHLLRMSLHQQQISHLDGSSNHYLTSPLATPITTPLSSPRTPQKSPRQSHHSRSNQASKHSIYSSSIDIWACGCILAEMMLRRPLFPARENTNLLTLFVDYLGCPSPKLLERIPPSHDLTHLQTLMKENEGKAGRIRNLFPPNCDSKAIDLCLQMLKFDPMERITIEQALEHDFFAEFHESEDLDETCSTAASIDENHKSMATSAEEEEEQEDQHVFYDPTNEEDFDLNKCLKMIIATSKKESYHQIQTDTMSELN